MTSSTDRTVLLVGASRGLGLALAGEFADRGRRVIATVRGTIPDALRAQADRSEGRITVETVDMTVPEQVDALHDRLADTTIDLLFVNGAITRGDVPIGEVTEETFVEVMTTNAYAPMRFVEAFADLGGPTATVPIEESIPGVVDTVTAAAGEPGLRFLDWRGETVPW